MSLDLVGFKGVRNSGTEMLSYTVSSVNHVRTTNLANFILNLQPGPLIISTEPANVLLVINDSLIRYPFLCCLNQGFLFASPGSQPIIWFYTNFSTSTVLMRSFCRQQQDANNRGYGVNTSFLFKNTLQTRVRYRLQFARSTGTSFTVFNLASTSGRSMCRLPF